MGLATSYEEEPVTTHLLPEGKESSVYGGHTMGGVTLGATKMKADPSEAELGGAMACT